MYEGERARADTDSLYKSDGEESFGRVRQSSEGEASKPIMSGHAYIHAYIHTYIHVIII